MDQTIKNAIEQFEKAWEIGRLAGMNYMGGFYGDIQISASDFAPGRVSLRMFSNDMTELQCRAQQFGIVGNIETTAPNNFTLTGIYRNGRVWVPSELMDAIVNDYADDSEAVQV